MNPNTASLEELRDWLAERRGWKLVTSGTFFGTNSDGSKFPWRPTPDWPLWHLDKKELREGSNHPIPATLDAAAAAMPDGWTWERAIELEADCELFWLGYPKNITRRCPERLVRLLDTGDEIRDRYAMAVACIQAQEAK